jgi:hypothetical protein
VIQFGNIPQRSGTWAWLKPLIAQKSLMLQYEDDGTVYTIYGYDLPEVLFCTIWKGTLPVSVVNSGYSQAQNDADKTDFETNFQAIANRSIDDIPSKIITNTIRLSGGGSANLAVDGSVTPVVFEYNPPDNYDIQVNALSFLFEISTSLLFGNKFVVTALNTLTNGMLLECKADDLSFTWQNMRRTRDLFEISRDFTYITGTTNFLKVDIFLPNALRLARLGTFAQQDYLRVTVRDNLAVASLSFAEAYFQGVKI